MATQPRRKAEFIQQGFFLLLAAVLAYGANNMQGLNKNTAAISTNYHELARKVSNLETTIQMGMLDRFTGTEGAAMEARLDICEKVLSAHEGRLDAIDKWCASVTGRMGVP